MQAFEFADRLRDTETELELAERLRAVAEEERFSFINEMLDVHLIVGLDLAKKCLTRRDYLSQLMETGLARTSDLSSINLWLAAIVPKLGVRRVIKLLYDNLNDYPFAVGSALYFTSQYVEQDDTRAVEALRELFDAAKQKGLRVPESSTRQACDS